MKSFKYFDLNNNGSVEPDEFAKAIEKIGIQIPTQRVSIPFQFKEISFYDGGRILKAGHHLKLYLLNYRFYFNLNLI